jgi:hypothetical protein
MDVLGFEERGEGWGEGTILRNLSSFAGMTASNGVRIRIHLSPNHIPQKSF